MRLLATYIRPLLMSFIMGALDRDVPPAGGLTMLVAIIARTPHPVIR